MGNNRKQRITPDSITNNQIQPVATPVNKLQTYKPDLSEAQKSKQTYEGLAAFGKGVLDLSVTYKKQAQEHMLAYYMQTEEKNRNDWAEVSKNIDGMAKFNPYNKDAYRQIQSAEIFRAGLMEMESIPELEKKSPDEFNALIQQNQTNVMARLKEFGIEERNYQEYLFDYDNRLNTMKHSYATKNAEYQYQLYQNKLAGSYGHQYWQALRDNTDGVMALQTVSNYAVEAMNATGMPSDTKAAVMLNALKQGIAIEPSKFKSSDIVLAFSDYKIDGKTMNELIPDFESKIRLMVREAKTADLNDQKIESETKQFNQKLAREGAITEAMNMLSSGETLSPAQQQEYFMNLAQNYGLDGSNTIRLFKDIADGRKTIADLKNIPSDPEIRVNLAAGVVSGDTTREDIVNAMGNGTLSYTDGLQLFQTMETEAKKKQTLQQKQVDEHVKRATADYIKGTADIKPILKRPEAQQAFHNEMMALRGQFEEGKITYEQFNNELYALKQDCEKAQARLQKTRTFKQYQPVIDKVAGKTTITDKQWRQVNTHKSTLAFKRMSFVRTDEGYRDTNVSIASAPQEKRMMSLSDGTLVNRPHKGYDITGTNYKMGRALYAPMEGRVVGVYQGNNNGAGNIVILRCENGKYVKLMHLQSAGLPEIGSLCDTSTVIGHIGNTGDVKNKKTGSLHIEFYDKEGNWIPAYKFM